MSYGSINNGSTSELTERQIKNILSLAHPVGSLYITDNDTSPASLFGGTWEQIKDKFILAAGDTYAAGSTGGGTEHSHAYAITYVANYNGIVGGTTSYSVMAYNGTTGGNNIPANSAGTGIGNTYSAVSTSANQTIWYQRSLGRTGYGTSMPPYITKYVWQRIEDVA